MEWNGIVFMVVGIGVLVLSALGFKPLWEDWNKGVTRMRNVRWLSSEHNPEVHRDKNPNTFKLYIVLSAIKPAVGLLIGLGLIIVGAMIVL